MSNKTKRIYEFGGFRLEPGECLLVRDGEAVSLTAKVFDLLVLLVENRGRLMEKDELLAALWPDSTVEESNLSVNISALRKALGENPARPQFIETVPRRGYRFIAPVTESVAPAAAEARNEPAAEARGEPAALSAPASSAATAAALAAAPEAAEPASADASRAAPRHAPTRHARRGAACAGCGWL